MLVDKDIKKWIVQEGMIQDYRDLDIQLQPNGFDLSLGKVLTFDVEESIIDFSNKNRKITEHVVILPEPEGQYRLRRGIYLFRANETVQMPENVTGLGIPRSSLYRAGAILNSGVIDAGYSGHLVFSVYIGSRMILEKDARFVQLIFFKLDSTPNRLYQGIYKEEK